MLLRPRIWHNSPYRLLTRGVLNKGLSLTGIGGETLIKAGIMLAAGYADTMHPKHRGVLSD